MRTSYRKFRRLVEQETNLLARTIPPPTSPTSAYSPVRKALESFSIRGRPAIKDFLDNCPYHPDPVDLPGAIPDQILTALTAVDGILTSVLDPNVVVSLI